MQQNHLVDCGDGPLLRSDLQLKNSIHWNVQPFIWSKCCHLTLCFHLMKPNLNSFQTRNFSTQGSNILNDIYCCSIFKQVLSLQVLVEWQSEKKVASAQNFSLLNFFELKLSFKLKTCDWRFSSCLGLHWKQNRLWSKGDANKIPSRPKEALCFWGLVPETLQIEIVEKLVSARFLNLAVRLKTCVRGLNLATLVK